MPVFNSCPPPGQNGCYFGRQHFKCILLNENDRVPIQISLKFVPRSPVDNQPAFVQVMAWRHWCVARSSSQYQDGCYFANNIFQCIFLKEKFCVLSQVPLKFIPKDQVDNKSSLVQVMAWCQKGTKPLSEPMMTLFTDLYRPHQALIFS